MQASQRQESFSLYVGISGLVLGFLIGIIVFQGRDAPIFGGLSIGLVAGLAATFCGSIAFLLAYLPTLPKVAGGWFARTVRVIDVFAMTFAHVAIVFLALFGTASVFQMAFDGLSLDNIASSAVVAGIVATVSYILYSSGGNIRTSTIPILLITLMLFGAMTSMLTADNKEWWQDNFSALGGGSGVSASTFNITMIIAGIILTTMSNYLADELIALAPIHRLGKRWKIKIIRSILAMMGLSLVLLGLVDVAMSVFVHNIGAYGLGILFIVLIAALPYLLPGLPWVFYAVSFAMLGGLVAALVLVAPVGYLNITAFELIAAGIVFVWFTLFVRQLSSFETDVAAGDISE
ncbi:MAG: hypothetical protein WBA28_09470 [Microbacteriaceae bacterium]